MEAIGRCTWQPLVQDEEQGSNDDHAELVDEGARISGEALGKQVSKDASSQHTDSIAHIKEDEHGGCVRS